MMKTAQLTRLIEQANSKMQQAAKELANVNGMCQFHRNQIDKLSAYKMSYLNELTQRHQSGISSIYLHEYRGFIKELDAQTQVQHRKVLEVEQQLRQVRRAFINSQINVKKLTLLQQQYQQKRQLLEQKNEQKLLDELGARMALNRR